MCENSNYENGFFLRAVLSNLQLCRPNRSESSFSRYRLSDILPFVKTAAANCMKTYMYELKMTLLV